MRRIILTILTATILTSTAIATDADSATELKLTGNVDASQLRSIVDSYPSLRRLDLSSTTITTLPPYSLAATAIEELVLPNGLTTIGEGALAGMPIRQLSLPSTLTTIGAYALSGCASLTAIDGGSALSIIADGAMRRCPALTTIPLPATLDSIGNSALRGSAITTLDLSSCSALRAIGDWAFEGCTSLTTASIPGSIRSLGTGIFFGDTSLSTLTLASGVDAIGDFTFAYAGLTDINAESLTTVPDLGLDTWHGIDRPQTTLTVVAAMLDDFASTPEWKEFRIVSADDPSGINAIAIGNDSNISARFAADNLLVNAPAGLRMVAVYDLNGRLRCSYANPVATDADTHYLLNASDLPPSLYVVTLSLPDGSLAAVKARK